jgi:transcriptional regulator with XRE-family HTH domain
MSRELKPLREVLERAVGAARLPVRTVEQALGVRAGGWDQILAGKRTLRVRHLLALAGLLRVPPADFLEIGLPEASRVADRRLTEWIDPPRPSSSAKMGDWQARIEDAVRRELDAALERDESSSG